MRIYNALSKQTQDFNVSNDTVNMYVCGITPYDSAHLGHAMSAVIFDMIRRYFEFKGFNVNYIQNFTDVDDKMINAANIQNIEVSELAEKNIAEYLDELKSLNVKVATKYPKATEEIPAIIELISQLIENNFAYFSNGKKYEYDILVIASPLHSIKKFININTPVKYNSNKTIYISSSKNIMSKSILLVPDEKFHTNSIQCLTNISKGYSNNDKSLYSLSTLNINAKDDELLNEFKHITGLTSNKIQLVKSYVIKHALPQANVELKSKDNIHFCGDWNIEPSIDGALKSGRILAEFLNKLK